MARGNQREKAREKTLKEAAGKVFLTLLCNFAEVSASSPPLRDSERRSFCDYQFYFLNNTDMSGRVGKGKQAEWFRTAAHP
jgi:4F5 protein related disordered region